MDIFESIRESHDLQRDLARKLTASRGDPRRRDLLFLQLKVELGAHEAAEERFLYVPMLMDDAGLDASRHALHEHHQIDELLEDLSVRNKQAAGWLARAKTLSQKVRHHLKEEEAKFFPLAGRLLTEPQKAKLGRAYEREMRRMRAKLAADYALVGLDAAGRIEPARAADNVPAARGNAQAGAKLRGKAKPRRTA